MLPQRVGWPAAAALDAEVISTVAHTTLAEQLAGQVAQHPALIASLHVHVLSTTTSTMNDVAQALRAVHEPPAPTPLKAPDIPACPCRGGDIPVVLAEQQTQGRGRRERSWATPPRSGLALSLALPLPQLPANRWGWVPLLAGVAAAQAAGELAQVEVKLKWPNDLLVQGRKLGGVLVEHHRQFCVPIAVVGVGLNVDLAQQDVPVATATSLRAAGAAPVDRNVVAGRLIGLMRAWHHRWVSAKGQADLCGLAQQYHQLLATVGQQVQVSVPDGQVVQGLCVGVSQAGHVQVRTEQGEVVSCAAADVHHLRPTQPMR